MWNCTDFTVKSFISDHQVIAKGCSEGAHDNQRETAHFNTKVTLPWANDEELIGDTVFCNDKEFCNGSVKLRISVTFIIACVLCLKFLN